MRCLITTPNDPTIDANYRLQITNCYYSIGILNHDGSNLSGDSMKNMIIWHWRYIITWRCDEALLLLTWWRYCYDSRANVLMPWLVWY